MSMIDNFERTGSLLPKGAAYAFNDGRGLKLVTWEDVKRARIERQRLHYERVIAGHCMQRRAALIWTFFVPGSIYGGWHLYIKTIQTELWLHPRLHAHDLSEGLTLDIMRMFPCGLLPVLENFEAWKEAFANHYTYGRKRGGRRQGIVFGWTEVSPGDYPNNFQGATR